MKKRKSFIGITILAVMLAGMTSCSTGDSSGTDSKKDSSKSDEIKEFKMFVAVAGNEINSKNVCQDKIAEITGAKVKETWLTGQTADEAIGMMVANGVEKLPDFVDASAGLDLMLDAGGFIAIDEYWDDYPNLKNFYTEEEWNTIRAEDGHVYIVPQFGNVYEKDMQTVHSDEAFWIQARVLKWANYPEIVTLDDYFKVIEDYLKANPTAEDGTPNIGYEICCDDWKYFGLENPPMFLDGYPNDGCCIVDRDTKKAINYNTTPTANKFFKKMNDMFKKGIVDPESFTNKYDQYIAKISSGRVLGLCDQFWNFQDADISLKDQKLYDRLYIPVGVVIEKGIEEHYHNAPVLDVSNGVGITKGCKDVPGAMKFLNDLLSEEVLTLRNWGIKDVDYSVDENGLFYLTDEQYEKTNDKAYRAANRCFYSYMPFYKGMSQDGKNAWGPEDQPGEFYKNLSEPIKECLAAYDAQTFVQLLNPAKENSDWFPMWSFSNTFTTETDHGKAKVDMDEVKHEYLPKVIMADDFDSAWEEYMGVLKDRVNLDAYLKALDEEIQRRIDNAKG